MARQIPLVHPGVILLEEWMNPLGVSQSALAKGIGVSPRRINEIVHGNRSITAETAVLLGQFFGVEAEGFINLQSHYDVAQAREVLGPRLAGIERFGVAA
ncbi:HigA family addiction module antitoxin [Xylophilus sp. GW821-FHT01B05]